MENASKALIIAGAILLSIVLITLGVLIIGRGQEAVDKANIDDQVLSSWNQKWTKYEGTNVSGTTVNNLINEVISSNKIATSNEEYEKVIRLFSNGPTTSNRVAVSGKLKLIDQNGKTLEVGTDTCTTYAKANAKYSISTKVNTSGYVFDITITAN